MRDDPRTFIRKAVEVLRVEADQVIELRAPHVPRRYGKPAPVAGWFDDPDALVAAAIRLEEGGAPGIYVTLNVVDPNLLARACNRLDPYPKTTTADQDVVLQDRSTGHLAGRSADC